MEGEGGTKRRVCVTGAGGFVASWLVKLLLSEGYFVHGTVRDPDDEKNRHLKRLEGSRENLQIFHADLLDYSSIFSAITGCEGVFHVASPVLSRKASNPEVELLAPAVIGTLNVLRACSEAKIKRVIVVSSVAAVIMNPNWPKDRAMDEECWSDIEYCKKTEGLNLYRAGPGPVWMFEMWLMQCFCYMRILKHLDDIFVRPIRTIFMIWWIY